MIEGVAVKELSKVHDNRGWLMEILRKDDGFFRDFGQVYLSTAYLGVVKAWHLHRKQTDNFTCILGKMRVALYDPREGSKTKGEVNEFVIDSNKPILISVPPGVYHGFKAIGRGTAFFLSIPDLPYDREKPDEERLPPDTDQIPYEWNLTPGRTHG